MRERKVPFMKPQVYESTQTISLTLCLDEVVIYCIILLKLHWHRNRGLGGCLLEN